MARGGTMGDEFHQRNIASSAFADALAPHIARLEHDKQQIAEVMDFLSVTVNSSLSGDGLPKPPWTRARRFAPAVL